MRRSQTKAIIAYYYGIPGMVKLLKEEWADLEEEYSGLRGVSVDGLPHGSVPGNPTVAQAERMEEKRVRCRMEEIAVKVQVLEADAAVIRGCLDTLRGEYKRLLFLRGVHGYSWAKIASVFRTPDSTARNRYDRALQRLGEALEEVPMSEEILGRASRARV